MATLADRYAVIENIGQGNFGVVDLVQSLDDGDQYVRKTVNLKGMKESEAEGALQEAALLSELSHPCIVAYKESVLENKTLCIVMEYCDGGDLNDLINEQNELTEDEKYLPEGQILFWFVQIALALRYIHNRNILHRDLKAQNIFLTNDRTLVKLGDFGISKVLSSDTEFARTAIGTPFYLSPEICEGKKYNKKSDIWALGCILYELCTLKHAFTGKNLPALVLKILRGQFPPIPPEYSDDLRDLIGLMLNQNPKARPTIDEVIDSPLLRDLVVHFESGEDEQLFSDYDEDEDEDEEYDEDGDDLREWVNDNAHRYLDSDGEEVIQPLRSGENTPEYSMDEDEDVDEDEDEDTLLSGEDEDEDTLLSGDEEEDFHVQYAKDHPNQGTVVLSPRPGPGVLDEDDVAAIAGMPDESDTEGKKAEKYGWTEQLEDQIEAIQGALQSPRVSRTDRHRQEIKQTGKSSHPAATPTAHKHDRHRSAPNREQKARRGQQQRHASRDTQPGRSKSRGSERGGDRRRTPEPRERRRPPSAARQRSQQQAQSRYQTPAKPRKPRGVRAVPRTAPPKRRQEPRTRPGKVADKARRRSSAGGHRGPAPAPAPTPRRKGKISSVVQAGLTSEEKQRRKDFLKAKQQAKAEAEAERKRAMALHKAKLRKARGKKSKPWMRRKPKPDDEVSGDTVIFMPPSKEALARQAAGEVVVRGRAKPPRSTPAAPAAEEQEEEEEHARMDGTMESTALFIPADGGRISQKKKKKAAPGRPPRPQRRGRVARKPSGAQAAPNPKFNRAPSQLRSFMKQQRKALRDGLPADGLRVEMHIPGEEPAVDVVIAPPPPPVDEDGDGEPSITAPDPPTPPPEPQPVPTQPTQPTQGKRLSAVEQAEAALGRGGQDESDEEDKESSEQTHRRLSQQIETIRKKCSDMVGEGKFMEVYKFMRNVDENTDDTHTEDVLDNLLTPSQFPVLRHVAALISCEDRFYGRS